MWVVWAVALLVTVRHSEPLFFLVSFWTLFAIFYQALDSDFTEENRRKCAEAARPLTDAVEELTMFASSPEFASKPAKISPQVWCGHMWKGSGWGGLACGYMALHIPYSGTRPLFLVVKHTRPMERGPCSTNSTLVVFENTAKLKPNFKMNFLPMKGESSITSCCIVLMFKSAKIWWLVKEILVSKALGIFFSWIMIASIKLMTRTMYGCLILNELGRRRVKLCQRVMATVQC